MTLHDETFNYITPSQEQLAQMRQARKAAAEYAKTIDQIVPEGPDKTYLLRKLREVSMWVNITITRQPDGTPRGGL